MEREMITAINEERATRNSYYKYYNKVQNVDEETLTFYKTMYLMHDYTYATLCAVAGCEYHKVADDYNAAHGRRL